jgi:hypothetical protein
MKAAGHLVVSVALFGLMLGGCREEIPVPITRQWGPTPGKPVDEHRVTVRDRPEIEAKDGYSLLRLPAVKGRPIEVICGEAFSPWLRTLPKDKPLTFTVWQTKRVDWHTGDGQEEYSWQSEIELIKDGDVVIHDAAICPQHKVRMKRTDIEISYGLPSQEFFEASKEFMGNPGFTLGGCVVTNHSPKTERGYVCAECVAAYNRWEQKMEAEREARRAKASKDN